MVKSTLPITYESLLPKRSRVIPANRQTRLVEKEPTMKTRLSRISCAEQGIEWPLSPGFHAVCLSSQTSWNTPLAMRTGSSAAKPNNIPEASQHAITAVATWTTRDIWVTMGLFQDGQLYGDLHPRRALVTLYAVECGWTSDVKSAGAKFIRRHSTGLAYSGRRSCSSRGVRAQFRTPTS